MTRTRRAMRRVGSGVDRARVRAALGAVACLLTLAFLAECDAPAQAQEFHETAAGLDHLTWRPGWDVGVGFVRIPPSPDGPPGSAPSDTIVIRSGARPAAAPVALAWHREYRLLIETAEEGLEDGALEVGYEERALPVMEVEGDGGWLLVSYAFDDGGGMHTGWVDSTDPRLEYVPWSGWLERQGVLFFVAPDSIAFFDGPDGEPIDLALLPGAGSRRFDYGLYPLRTDGEWMEVRVASPSDYCGADAPAVDAQAWIRYLDPQGRPRVWYFTRGC